MPERIYIAHPYRGKPENLMRITAICRALACEEIVPVSPVHMFAYLDEFNPAERQLALRYGLSQQPRTKVRGLPWRGQG